VRSDASVRLLDVEELKAQIEQVAAAADETYAALRPFLAAQALHETAWPHAVAVPSIGGLRHPPSSRIA
jgi:hypothetical protein